MTSGYNPLHTRSAILDAAFGEIYRLGFQAASLNDILARTGVTKGALYHHFPTKKALGLAVIDEIIGPYIREKWLCKMDPEQSSIDALIQLFQSTVDDATESDTQLGCPFYNLAQEMSPIDDDFRRHLSELFCEWRTLFAGVVRRGQERGEVRLDIEAEQVATFLITTLEGTLATVKLTRDPSLFAGTLASLTLYLNSLRTPVS